MKIFIVFCLATIISACGPAEIKNSDYVPASLEEQYVFSNLWCGQDFVSYAQLANGTKVNTLFKIDPSESGVFYIDTITVSNAVHIVDSFKILCDFLDSNTLNCAGIRVNYVLQNSSLSTDLLPSLIPGLKLTKLRICTKQELLNF